MVSDRITIRFKDIKDLHHLKKISLNKGIKVNKLVNQIIKNFIEDESEKQEKTGGTVTANKY